MEEAYSFYGEGGNNSNGISGGDNKPTRDIDQLVKDIKISISEVKNYLTKFSILELLYALDYPNV